MRQYFLVTTLPLLALLGAIFTTLPACSSAGIALREKMGIPKREQVVDRVKEARDGQQDAKKQFASALDEFLAVTGSSGSDLEAKYRKLSKSYEQADAKAGAVRDRIKSVDAVGAALFKEWRGELDQYTDANLRASSERLMQQTHEKFDKLMDSMRAASSKMDPVLAAFKNQVLFLKHNLNAQAVASLQSTATQIQGDVGRLIQEMQSSIDEANAFIQHMSSAGN